MADNFVRVRPAPVLWDIYEEHFDEAAFLWRQWERDLECAHRTLADFVEGPEARLQAHLDALVLGGTRVAERMLVPQLTSADASYASVAAWVLLHAEDADHSRVIFAALSDVELPHPGSLGRALELALRRDLGPQLEAAWDSAPAAVRGAVFAPLAVQHPELAGRVAEHCLRADQPEPLRLAALRFVQASQLQLQLGSQLQLALRDSSEMVRKEALAAALVLQAPGAWEACRHAAASDGEPARVALAMLALRGRPDDVSIVLERASEPSVRRHALFALGFAGVVEVADVLVAALDDTAFAAVAAESLSAITGAVIDGPYRKANVATQELADDAPPPLVLAEDHLSEPHAFNLRGWWSDARGRFQPGQRYQYGQPVLSPVVSSQATMSRRTILAVWEAHTARRALAIDVRGWQSWSSHGSSYGPRHGLGKGKSKSG